MGDLLFLQRKFLYLVSPTGDTCSYARVGRGLLRTRTQMAWFFPLMLCSNNNLEKERSGQVKTGSESTAVPSQLKMLRFWKWNMKKLVCESVIAVSSVVFLAALLKESDPCPPRQALSYSFKVKK